MKFWRTKIFSCFLHCQNVIPSFDERGPQLLIIDLLSLSLSLSLFSLSFTLTLERTLTLSIYLSRSHAHIISLSLSLVVSAPCNDGRVELCCKHFGAKQYFLPIQSIHCLSTLESFLFKNFPPILIVVDSAAWRLSYQNAVRLIYWKIL